MTEREVTNINKNYKGRNISVQWLFSNTRTLLEQELELAAIVAWFKTRKEKIKAID